MRLESPRKKLEENYIDKLVETASNLKVNTDSSKVIPDDKTFKK